MPKMKSHKAATKRYKLTGSGKLRRRKAFKSHLLVGKSPKRRRRLGQMGLVSKADLVKVRGQLLYV